MMFILTDQWVRLMVQRLVSLWDIFFRNIIDIDVNGLYRNDGLIFIENSTDGNFDSIRKKLFRLFKEVSFSFNAETGLKTVEYPDIKLNLINGTVGG